MPPSLINDSTQATVSFRRICLSLCTLPTSTTSGRCSFRRYDTKSSGTEDFAELKNPEPLPLPNDTTEGDLGRSTDFLARVPSETSPLCFFEEVPPLLNVKVRLRPLVRFADFL